jgi:hypothetical protein
MLQMALIHVFIPQLIVMMMMLVQTTTATATLDVSTMLYHVLQKMLVIQLPVMLTSDVFKQIHPLLVMVLICATLMIVIPV